MSLRRTAAGLSRFAHLAGFTASKAEEDDKDKKDKDGKRAKKAEGDDDDGEDGEDESAKKARARERARCASIFGAAAAAGNLPLACELAFNTGLSSRSAVAMLNAAAAGQPQPARVSLGTRMSGVRDVAVGAGDGSEGQPKTKAEEAKSLASGILAAARAAGGKF